MTESEITVLMPTPGQLLRAKREELARSVEAVAKEMRLSVTVVSALENDDYSKLHGTTYIIGYWRSYAKLLGLDIDNVIDFHKTRLIQPAHTPMQNTDLRHVYARQEPSHKKSGLVFLGLSLVFVGGIWYWQAREQPWLTELREVVGISAKTSPAEGTAATVPGTAAVDTSNDTSVATNTSQNTSQVPTPNFGAPPVMPDPTLDASIANTADTANIPNPTTSPRTSDALSDPIDSVADLPTSSPILPLVTNLVTSIDELPTVVTNPAVVDVPDSPATLPADITDAPLAADAPRAVSEQPNPLGFLLVDPSVIADDANTATDTPHSDPNSPRWILFEVAEQTWLDVRDINGEKLVYRIATDGEILKLKGEPPFQVFIGTTRGVSVEYLGQPVNIKTHANGIFARFKIGRAL